MSKTSVVTESPVTVIEKQEKLPIVTKVSYGLGDFASQLFWSFSGSYLTIYYTDVMGIAPAVIAMIMLFSRIADGMFDPVLGAIADRTKSKHGRFRPYILYGTPFLALFSVLAFTSPAFLGSMDAKIAWALFTYLGLSALYTVVNIPYGSLASVMTPNPGERTALFSFRMTFTNLGSVLLSIASMPLIIFFSGGNANSLTGNGYTMTAVTLAVIAVPLFYVLFFNSKEVVLPINKAKVSFKESFVSVLSSKSLILIFFMLLTSLTAFFGRMGVQIYYYMYVIKRMDLVAVFMPLPAVGAVIGILLFTRFGTKIGKKNLLYISYFFSSIFLIMLYFIDFSNITMLLVVTFLFGLAQFGTPIVMAMIPDAIDELEYKKGVRVDGTAFAATSLATKFASALGGAVTVALLGSFGYVANADQTPEAIAGINLVVNILPALCFLLAMIPVFLYKLDDNKTREIREQLDAQRVNE
ncbi:MFS transporter [Niallia taxi]|uniref:MFS transporter n=1 Tax=Niallia taxi TaxID=2499688 RepID=A0A437K960_9BACI|nr:MFS transporter [Niallia taxi]MDK8643598.1 MFS transporter [Niallia taxi]MED4036480.1 MFS transporter [Niallia taxi]RVT60855.1 MFS transporter [Niallia taxi]